MPKTKVLLYRTSDGKVPLYDWLDYLPVKASIKCSARIKKLREFGHELRRPDADYLRDGIYELRISLQGIQYRILYFFHGQNAIIISHGIVKKQQVPNKKIDVAIQNRYLYLENPALHSLEEYEL